jgi:hypothetical protein
MRRQDRACRQHQQALPGRPREQETERCQPFLQPVMPVDRCTRLSSPVTVPPFTESTSRSIQLDDLKNAESPAKRQSSSGIKVWCHNAITGASPTFGKVLE